MSIYLILLKIVKAIFLLNSVVFSSNQGKNSLHVLEEEYLETHFTLLNGTGCPPVK